MGSNLAIENKEYGRSEFGSRQPVYVLDDPHDLLNQTVVFKETTQENAYREKSNIESFAAYLRRIDAPSWCKLPEPLSIVTREEKAVLVMRRARRIQLGRAALQRSASPEILMAFRRSIRFLAHFHAWRMEAEGPRFRNRRVVSKIAQNVLRLWALSGFKNNITMNDFDVIFRLIDAGFPCIPKKDAHPENWLLDDENNIVMLDLESVGECPLFFELAQLMDDYPVFPVDDCGWDARLEQCAFYIESLAEDGIDFSWNKADAPRLYEAFVLLRASFGLARNQARAGRIPSAALRASKQRDAHYRALLDYLGHLPNSAISALATKIRACC